MVIGAEFAGGTGVEGDGLGTGGETLTGILFADKIIGTDGCCCCCTTIC